MVLMVDVAYAWSDPKRALKLLRRWDHHLDFVETPLDVTTRSYAFSSRQ